MRENEAEASDAAKVDDARQKMELVCVLSLPFLGETRSLCQLAKVVIHTGSPGHHF